MDDMLRHHCLNWPVIFHRSRSWNNIWSKGRHWSWLVDGWSICSCRHARAQDKRQEWYQYVKKHGML